MSATSVKIDQIVRSVLHPTLKREGFRKSARTFRRVIANCTQIVNIQGSWTNYADQGQFTINLGVYFPEAARLDGTFPVKEHPLESDCLIRERIGFLMPAHRDYWWMLDVTTDVDWVAQDITDNWIIYGKPWLEDKSTYEGAKQFALQRKLPYWASIFCLLQGDGGYANKYFNVAIEEAFQEKNNPLYLHLIEWGHSQGLV